MTAKPVVIAPPRPWRSLDLGELWSYRELLVFLAWRDIQVRYRQTVFGFLWAIVQPLLPTLVFSVFLGRWAKMPSDGLPYPVFVFAAMVPWQLFSYSLAESSGSLVSNRNLITKIYFPRLLVPVSTVVVALVDFCIGLAGILAMMAYFGVPFSPSLVLAPLFALMAVMAALSVGLWLSALNAKYRDVRYTVPFLIQFWLFATPVVYPASVVPERWQLLYSLNPMTGVISGFRWALFGGGEAPGMSILLSLGVVLALFVGGVVYFRRTEADLVDLI